MRAAQFERPHQLNVITKPLRALHADEVLVQVGACGVCGTDVHILEGTSRSTPPVVLGHEYAGTVTEAGKEVTAFHPGDRVAVDPNIACGSCYYCRRGEVHLCAHLRALGVDIDGGMAEYSIVPARQAFLLPQDMPMEKSAFIEPVSCCIHGVDRARITAGDTVLILGGGTIGLLMLQLVRNAGAARTVISEPLEHKRAIARRLGADIILNPAETDLVSTIRDITGVGADVVIECAGRSETMRVSLALARRGGVVEFFGVCPIGETIPVEPNQIYFKELTIVGSYVNPHTFARSVDILRMGKINIDAFQIDRFPLDGVLDALAYQREGRTLKCVIQPNG